MTDRRSLSVIAAAIAASASALAQQITDSDSQALPVNVHTAITTLSAAATDLADAVDQLATVHETTDAGAGLADRVTALEKILSEAGLTPPAAPAPAPAAPAGPGPAL